MNKSGAKLRTFAHFDMVEQSGAGLTKACDHRVVGLGVLATTILWILIRTTA